MDLSSGKRYRGVAPKARLIALKVLDRNGAGNTSDVISAIEFVTANKGQLGVDIINLSLATPFATGGPDPLVQAVEAAVRAGIVVVASGGNYGVSPVTGLPGYAGILSPGNAPRQSPSDRSRRSRRTHAPTIASLPIAREDRRGATAGPSPIWSRPAGLVAAAARSSSLYMNNPALRVGDSYLRLSGASMAAGRQRNCRVDPGGQSNRVSYGTSGPNAVKGILQYVAARAR